MYDILWLLLRILVFLLGATSVIAAALSAIRTFVLPRSVSDVFSRNVFLVVRMFLNCANGVPPPMSNAIKLWSCTRPLAC